MIYPMQHYFVCKGSSLDSIIRWVVEFHYDDARAHSYTQTHTHTHKTSCTLCAVTAVSVRRIKKGRAWPASTSATSGTPACFIWRVSIYNARKNWCASSIRLSVIVAVLRRLLIDSSSLANECETNCIPLTVYFRLRLVARLVPSHWLDLCLMSYGRTDVHCPISIICEYFPISLKPYVCVCYYVNVHSLLFLHPHPHRVSYCVGIKSRKSFVNGTKILKSIATMKEPLMTVDQLDCQLWRPCKRS